MLKEGGFPSESDVIETSLGLMEAMEATLDQADAGMLKGLGIAPPSGLPLLDTALTTTPEDEIYTLIISLDECPFFEEKWKCKVDIPAKVSLEYLHQYTQQLVEFANDHLYMFTIAKTNPYDPIKKYDPSFNDKPIEGTTTTTTLADVFPKIATGHKLFYVFDFGDDWTFNIRKSNRKSNFAKPNTTYPQLLSQEGKKPEQYPDGWI